MVDATTTRRTIHVHKNQFHLAWDNSIPPIATIVSGETVEFDLPDAAGGQIGPQSTMEVIYTLDFSRVDQVNGPIYCVDLKLCEVVDMPNRVVGAFLPQSTFSRP